MDVKPIQWGENREAVVRLARHGQPMVELLMNSDETPFGVLQFPNVLWARLTKKQALKLGRALVKMGMS